MRLTAKDLKAGDVVIVPTELRKGSAALDPNGRWVVGLDHGDGTNTGVYESETDRARGWIVPAQEANAGLAEGWLVDRIEK